MNKFRKIHYLLPQIVLEDQNNPFRRPFMRMLKLQRGGGLEPPDKLHKINFVIRLLRYYVIMQ